MLHDSDILMIDAIGPFFRHYKRKRINWSKIPFSEIETESGLRPECLASIPGDFRKFLQKARTFGYNSLTLDDVAHLVPCDLYPEALQSKISAYRELYRELFEIATEEGLRVFLTTDIMFYNDALKRRLGTNRKRVALWLRDALDGLLHDFPEIAGVIMRFGETDGLDVHGDFRSQLLLKRPSHARAFLEELLPVFEQRERLLVFRTWSVGAHQIGDLIWNERNFGRVFEGLDSPALVISMKYGESDFFRYLALNKLFFAGDHKKIIELQARREYEGFGAYPSFVGWDSEGYLRELSRAKNVVGASVWCQTGGWGKLRQLTFLRNSSKWVEMNVFVLARLWQGITCEEAIEAYREQHIPDVPGDVLTRFLDLSDQVIKELLYVREFAERHLYFRRLRLPPQLFVFWDRIIVDHTMKKILACLIREPEAAVVEGYGALEKLREMQRIAKEHGLPTKGLKFQLATFEIMAVAREYFFRPYDEEIAERLKGLKADYRKRFKRNYSVMLDFSPTPVRRFHLRWLFALFFRERSRYRLLDEVVTLRMVAWAYPVVKRLASRVSPDFAQNQAMGLETIFR